MCLILLPAHSPAAPQPHAYSTIPTASPVTPPHALGRLWIQSKSTPGRLFDIKASLTETLKQEEKKKQQFSSALCRLTSSTGTAHWFVLFVLSDVLQKFHLLTVKIHERFWGFKCQFIGLAGCGLGIKTFTACEWSLWHGISSVFVYRMEVCWLTTPQHWLSMSVRVCGPTRRWSVWCHSVRDDLKLLARTAPPTPASKPNSPMSSAAPQTLRVSNSYARC